MKAADKKIKQADATRRDPRWAFVLARDVTADERFYYCVKTTGVYCRPSCAARTPLPENVQFHSTREEAEHAGFRPCRRCKPDQPSLTTQHATMVTQACRLIETSEYAPNFEALANHAKLSPYHFHRIFKTITGLTPHAYANAHRAKKIRRELEQKNGSVTNAIYDAGYQSSGRFYAESEKLLGMTASRYRDGGRKTTMHFALGECSLGSILVATSARGICSILLGDNPDFLLRDLQDRFPNAELIGGDNAFEKLIAQVIGFVEAPGLGLNLPLDVRGTAFQHRVWQALREIPAGTTASYTDIAERIGSPKAVRAVAGACAANPVAVAIPCHRVVRNDRGLSGYRWGVERKRLLLEREAKP
jgi:AraC family transcriptional regulator of adaptative response/methylated-DNA-[protein]-cysteine methyltransferase